MKTNFNFSALNSSGRRSFSLQKKSPRWKIVAISGALALVLGLVGCSLVKNNDKAETPTTTTTQDQLLDENQEELKDEHALLIDQLEISGLEMVDNLTPKIEAELQQQLEALVPEGGTVIDSSDVYIAPDGSAWVSEAEYLKYIESQKTTETTTGETGTGEVVQEGYMAPDGSVWVSEAEYLKYIESQKTNENGQGTVTEDTKVEGDYYLAPDGSVWESEADYLKYVNSSKETTVENGDVVEVEDNDLYKAPDGSYWESEKDYLNSLKAEESKKEEVKDEVVEETGKGSSTTDNYYIDPEGNRWESKEMYEEYIKGQEAVATTVETKKVVVEEKKEVKEEKTTVATNNEFYMSPDGELWVSEAAYLESIGASKTEVETGMGSDEVVAETTEGVSVIPESEYVEEKVEEQVVDNSNWYVDEYGNYWASYEDYVAYMEFIAQEDMGKTK